MDKFISKNKKHKNKKDKEKKASVSKKKKENKEVYFSFFTIILLLCLIQILISAVINISKVISYKAKIVQITNVRDAALELNEQLNESIKNFSNVAGLEAIARNNLKMSSEDEVMVIINSIKQNEEIENNSKKHFVLFKKD
ncbi:septum formation initiator family protein [bacterium]|nr:septum formation initiator family protein [bacterium]